jgi:anti-sigma regulatory factor (Ser/Thr protein kinase)
MTASLAIGDPSQVAAVRRAVTTLAERLGFDATRTGQAALVVTELATNILKHATRGEILVNHTCVGLRRGVELLALDSGPGLSNFESAFRDGHSTSGTLGHGLGAMQRNADFVRVFSQPSKGVAALCRIWDRPGAAEDDRPFTVCGVSVAKPGEEVSGDAWTAQVDRDQLSVVVADGLGHGVLASEASRCAITTFARAPRQAPSVILQNIHDALRATRGAAVGVLTVVPERELATFAGLGNIAGVILTAGQRRSLVSHNGTAGHAARSIRELTYPMPAGALFVLHSDGVSTHWNVADYPGLEAQDPALIAGVLYRDFARHHDDATVVVGKRSLAA